jgi:hypothetical protein
MKQLYYPCIALVMFTIGCMRHANEANVNDTAKIKLVVQEAIRRATDPSDKAALRTGQIFVNIEGLEEHNQPLSGISVPLDEAGHRAVVMFTAEHLRSTPVPKLAEDVLLDLDRARAKSRRP